MELRILPGNIANMIAAGEVVQRPASVVKELVENAVDAGASKVTVVIQDAGRTLIQVIDDGCGMSPDDAVLCFERHATSKIATADDLMNIQTFGFRGEALASIAAVAQVTLKTRRHCDETGVEVVFAGSVHQSTEETSTPVGTNFAVRDLFFNVPARRKFLKSDNVEFKHIVSEFNRVALTRPDVAFTLNHNGKDIFVLKAAKSLKFRIQDLLGTSAVNAVLDLHADTSLVTVNGFIGRPDLAKKGLGDQYFFVNGRYFRSPYLHKAVMKAYEQMVPEGVTPSYFIYLEMDPRSMDVNIHPTKTEIKFEDDSIIFQTLYACVRETLAKLSFGDSIDFDTEGAPQMPVLSSSFEQFRPVSMPSAGEQSSYNPFDNDGFPSEPDIFNGTVPPQDAPGYGSFPSSSGLTRGSQHPLTPSQNYGKLFEDRILPSQSIISLSDKYIITAVNSGLLLINVRRAKERILYERFLSALSRNEHVVQCSLFPEQVKVGVENCLLLMDKAPLLQSLGFDIRPFGNDTVVAAGVPEGYSAQQGNAEKMVWEILEIIKDDHSLLEQTMTATLAAKFAAAGAATEEKVSSTLQAQRLIDSLFACTSAEFTPSGHRTMVIVPVSEIDKKF